MKLPLSLTAPKMVLTFGKPSMRDRAVLLAIRRPPPIEVMTGAVMLVRLALPTNETSPDFVAVRLGAKNELKKFESNRAEPLTTCNDGTSKLETLAIVMLAIQIRFGRLTFRKRPLAWMLRMLLRLPSWLVNSVKRLLLLMFRVCTVRRSIPSKVLRKVSLISTVLAVVTPTSPKLSWPRAGSDLQPMLPTLFKAWNPRLDRRVRLVNVKAPSMDVRDVLWRLVIAPLFSQIRSPVILWMPEISMSPGAAVFSRMDPLKVLHSDSCVASAWEAMVAVAFVHWFWAVKISGQTGVTVESPRKWIPAGLTYRRQSR